MFFKSLLNTQTKVFASLIIKVTFLCSCPEFMAPEVVLTGQGLSPLFGPSGPKVHIEFR